MRIKTVDVDIGKLNRIEGLMDYGAVEILFRSGREPLGRARIPCNGEYLDPDNISPWIEYLQSPSPLDIPDENLPTVTVVICTRNRSDLLAITLDSLTRQEYPPYEILVVDNGCQDEIRKLTEQILPQARYLAEPRPGLDFARNRGLLAATGDIIAFLDDDTCADPFWVRSLTESFAAFPQAGAVTGLILPLELETEAQAMFEAYGGFARGFNRRVLPRDGQRRFGRKLPLLVEAIGVGAGCNMAFRSIVLRELSGFDEALDTGLSLPACGDLDIFYRVLRAGYELVYEPRAMIRHYHRRSKRELRRQLAGHLRSLSAFLIKTIAAERGLIRVQAIGFLAWRLVKNIYRLLRSLVGLDALPFAFRLHILSAGIVGLGSYHASKRRIQTSI